MKHNQLRKTLFLIVGFILLQTGSANAEALLDVVADISEPVGCEGDCNGSIILTITNGEEPYEFQWSGPTPIGNIQNPEGLCAGNYSVTISDAFGLETSTNVSLNEGPSTIDIGFLPVEDLSCIRESVVLSVIVDEGNDMFEFQWLNEDGTNIENGTEKSLQVSSPGVYYILINSLTFECSTIDSIQVNEDKDEPFADAGNFQELDCNGEELTLDGTDSSKGSEFIYNWTTDDGNITSGETTLTPLIDRPGTYIIQVINTINGCESFDEVIIVSSSNTTSSVILDVQHPSCFNESDAYILIDSVIGGSGFYQYSLNGLSYTNEPKFENLSSGFYTISIMDAFDCDIEQSIEIINPDSIYVTLDEDKSIVKGESIQLHAKLSESFSIIDTIIWNQEQSLSCIDCLKPFASPLETSFYSVQIQDINGCIAEDEQIIFVNDENQLFLGNAFTPNNDGINDVFFISAKDDILIETFKIYNRYGELVFQASNFIGNDPTFGWDGRYKNKDLNPGVYAYLVEYEKTEGVKELLVGNVNLLK